MKLSPFRLERFFAQYEFKAPFLLSSSDCESMAIGEVLSLESGAEAAFHQTWLGYTETSGHPHLREAIAQTYQHIHSDQILVHAGAEEAIFNFMNVALSAGDHVIVHTPCYQSLRAIAQSIGCEVTSWIAHEEAGWALDLNELKTHIRSNTRAIIINCPHNPTGYVMAHDSFSELVAIARHHNLLLFSDEVYRGLEHPPNRTLPAACDYYENAVSLGVMSKAYGLAGLRIGWIATRNSSIYQGMAAFKDYTSICNSAPSEYLATLALRHRDTILERNRKILAANLKVCDRFFGQHPDLFTWRDPDGGSTAFPRLTLAISVEDFCRDLIEQQGVLLLPSTCFDYGKHHFRLGLGRKNLPECIEHLETYLENTRSDAHTGGFTHPVQSPLFGLGEQFKVNSRPGEHEGFGFL